MADHAFFIGIGDAASFEIGHGDEGLLKGAFIESRKLVGEIHAAEVNGEADGGEFGVIFLKAFPKSDFRCSHNSGRSVI